MPLATSRKVTALCLGFLLASSFAYGVFAVSSGSKIQHLIFIVQENRSFDNYFGTFPGAIGLSSAPVCCPTGLTGTNATTVPPYPADINKPIMIVGDELPPGQMFPNASDTITTSDGADGDDAPFAIPTETNQDLSHAWQAAFTDWNYGQMNGFVVGENNTETMGYFNDSDIPYYWDYARNYVLDDMFFSSLMGPSFPNHLYIASGSAGNGTLANPNKYSWIANGTINNNPPTVGADLQIANDMSLSWTSMAQELSQHGVTWKWYTGAKNVTAPSYWDVLPVFSYFQQNPQLIKQNVVSTQDFVSAVSGGSLPSVSWIIPGSSWNPPTGPFQQKTLMVDCVTSEHPPARPDCGMDYVSYLVNQVMQSKYWDSTAIVITWDDYGGFYDQVAPPQVGNDGEGFRVPTLVISPYAKHGYIDNTPYEFGSFLSLIEATFGLPSLGARDSTGIGKNDMMNAFNLSQPAQPPLVEPANFVGPANIPPLSNGYHPYTTYSTTPTTVSTSTTTTSSTFTSTSSPETSSSSSSSTSASGSSTTSYTSTATQTFTPSSSSTISVSTNTIPSTTSASSSPSITVSPPSSTGTYLEYALIAAGLVAATAAYLVLRKRE